MEGTLESTGKPRHSIYKDFARTTINMSLYILTVIGQPKSNGFLQNFFSFVELHKKRPYHQMIFITFSSVFSFLRMIVARMFFVLAVMSRSF